MSFDFQWLHNHALQWALVHAEITTEPQDYADWYVREYGDEDNPPSHPAAYRVFKEDGNA